MGNVTSRLAVFVVDKVPSPIGNNSMQAGSPLTDYTVRAIAYVLVIAVLLAILFVGAFLVLNLGLLSKRKEDRVGGRTPSDVGILKGTVWPESPDESPQLPAEEEEEQDKQKGEWPERKAG